MNLSIHFRILASAAVTLVLFLGLTGAVLDKAFSKNSISAQQENLRTQIYTLLAAADLDDNEQLVLPDEITEPRLNIIDSTLHARVVKADNQLVWQSQSMLNTDIQFPENIKTGEFYFSDSSDLINTYSLLSFSTQWETEKGEQTYIFQLAENKKNLTKQIKLFRKNLWIWLAGMGALLLLAQTLILRWSLKPLRLVANDVLDIERGTSQYLSDNYPKELSPLTDNLNQLLQSSQNQLSRYRDALGNMAHSLKTPITVLHGIITTSDIKQSDTAIEQLDTINTIVDYQLGRAATAGRQSSNVLTHIKPIVEKILQSMNKVYRDKNISQIIEINNTLQAKIDQGDLYELLGNLLDNASKWCNNKITLSAEESNNRLVIVIEDDGSGINETDRERILQRGQRADQDISGHGLGMAIVSDILLMYQGSMEITDSQLGGAKITVAL